MNPKNGFYLWNISQNGFQTLLNEEAALGELAHFARSIPPFFPTWSMQEWQKYPRHSNVAQNEAHV
jgi:hypothetical protein